MWKLIAMPSFESPSESPKSSTVRLEETTPGPKPKPIINPPLWANAGMGAVSEIAIRTATTKSDLMVMIVPVRVLVRVGRTLLTADSTASEMLPRFLRRFKAIWRRAPSPVSGPLRG